MNVSVQGDVYAGVAQKLTEGLNIKSQFNAASCKGVPLRYNKDKREKPVFSMGLSVCRSHFNSFSNIETDAKI